MVERRTWPAHSSGRSGAEVLLGAAPVPLGPGGELPLPAALERLSERGQRERRGRLGAAAEAERQHRLARQLATEGDVARSGAVVLPGERAVVREVLPQVADAGAAGAGAAPGAALLGIDRRQRQPERPLLGPQQLVAAVIGYRGACCSDRCRPGAARAARTGAATHRRSGSPRSAARRGARTARRAAPARSARGGARCAPPALRARRAPPSAATAASPRPRSRRRRRR